MTLRWNKGFFPGDKAFSFLKDWGSVKIWKFLIGIVGFNQDESCSSSFETEKGDNKSIWSGLHKVGDYWDLLIFLAVFKICSGSETPKCKGELGLLLVPTPLVATMNYLVKCSL